MTTIKFITTSAISVVIMVLVTTTIPHVAKLEPVTTTSNVLELASTNHKYGSPRLLNTTLYAEKCLEGSEGLNFLTPIHKCYNGYNYSHALFTEHDIFDVLITIEENKGTEEQSNEATHGGLHAQQVGIQRTFYKSTDGSCSGGKTDSFNNIPIGTCVGPFGPPYPWGVLEIVEDAPSIVTAHKNRI